MALGLVFIVACKKDPAPASPSIDNKQVSEFDSCACVALTGKQIDSEYIRVNLNGVPVCFDQVPIINDTFPNMLKYGFILRDTGNQYYDNLYMLRNARNSHWQAALYLENTHALTKTYPYDLPRPNPEPCEIGELQINDLDQFVSCYWCPENAYSYLGLIVENGVKMEATSFKGNVFEGVFEGAAVTGSGKIVQITNGKFRIRLVVFNQTIDVR
jgi:hypothetical protein